MLTLTERQRLIRRTAAEFARRELAPDAAMRDRERRFDRPPLDLVGRPRPLIFIAVSARARARAETVELDLVGRPRPLIFIAVSARARARAETVEVLALLPAGRPAPGRAPPRAIDYSCGLNLFKAPGAIQSALGLLKTSAGRDRRPDRSSPSRSTPRPSIGKKAPRSCIPIRPVYATPKCPPLRELT